MLIFQFLEKFSRLKRVWPYYTLWCLKLESNSFIDFLVQKFVSMAHNDA